MRRNVLFLFSDDLRPVVSSLAGFKFRSLTVLDTTVAIESSDGPPEIVSITNVEITPGGNGVVSAKGEIDYRGAPLAIDMAFARPADNAASAPMRVRAAIKGDLAQGRTHFNAVCSSCHGSGGLGNPALQVPRLAGIDPVYLARQFAAYRSGKRGYHKDDKYGRQMRAGAGMLDAKLDQDVMAYIATLKP